MHLQAAALFLSRQSALVPQGDGLQGCTTSTRIVAERLFIRFEVNINNILLVMSLHWAKGSPW
jgi:hypothetical protein